MARVTRYKMDIKANKTVVKEENGHILAQLSHELQTPAAIMQGSIELLLPVVPLEHRSVFIKARDSIKRASQSISHLIKLANLGSLVKFIRPKPLLMGSFVSEIVEDMKSLADSKSIKLKSFCSPRAVALADPEFIREVICNLITNSLRHTKRGGRIAIRVRTKVDFVQIAVIDNGRGIARAEFEKIYNYLYCGHISKIQGGYGLGLNICRQIVAAHNGSLLARSTPGQGATFYVLLPRAKME